MSSVRTLRWSLCRMRAVLAFIAVATVLPAQQQAARPWMNTALPPEQRAELVLQQLTLDEKLAFAHGNGMAHVPNWQMPLTHLANGGAGYVEGVARLGIPGLLISDAAYGVRDSGANGRYSTALPSNLGAASAWDVDSACAYGEVIGRELRAQGYDMTLGGGVNLAREPRNGRTFEYAGEDPLLAGTLVGSMMKCEQAQHVVGDIKHYALNDQETGRSGMNIVISRRAMQESDLLAFHIGISIANPGAVMCSYNRINGDYACENRYTLHDVLKTQWGYKGFVLSDWGGTHSTEKASAAGLDQEQPMAEFMGDKLKQAVEAGRVPMAEIDDHARRVLYALFASGVVDHPPQPGVVDVEKGLEVAQRIEEKSIVLLKNSASVLPIDTKRVHRIAVIGGHADVGMISGGGSAQVDPPGGNAIMPEGQGSTNWHDHVWFPTSPLKALRASLPDTAIEYNDGADPAAAARLAGSADLAIVFAYQWEAEDLDLPNLALPDGQEALIEQVAAANAHTVVVLESGTAVTMPWLGKVAAVVEAWYAGSAGHRALANVLTGTVNPSGKLALSFPATESDLPRATIAPLTPSTVHNAADISAADGSYAVPYHEGARVGYKWYETEHRRPLFAFGYGLSYTAFAYTGLQVDAAARAVTFTVKNTGKRAGAEIAEVYAAPPSGSDEPYKRLVGWKRVTLAAGESQTVTVPVDTRALQIFDEATESWSLPTGTYTVLVGAASDNTPLTAVLPLH
ncbi:MAG: glycoside hydrolase family 3 C-terminal domain-containing protein [Acidobacteriota bacterium]|nr:glycoside hydrolase family 3 C-terminal domain-containing protein [Acidobacteriota bacterium]